MDHSEDLRFPCHLRKDALTPCGRMEGIVDWVKRGITKIVGGISQIDFNIAEAPMFNITIEYCAI